MARQLVLMPVLFSFMANSAFATNANDTNAANAKDASCETGMTAKELKDFPIKDLDQLATKKETKGTILPTEIGVTADGKFVSSTLPQGSLVFFSTNILTQFSTLDARKTAEYDNSLAIRFLREYGLKEMSLLGPDLTKPDPFLDKPQMEGQTPSSDKINETNLSLAELTRRMNALLNADQSSALQNALKGNFVTSMKQVEGNVRLILTKVPFLKNNLGSFASDKKFLQDLQILLAGNLTQFQSDVVFMSELQARYRKTRDALEKLSKEGEGISNMKAAILANIKDEFTKQQIEKELVRFDQRITDLTAGIAIADTFINMWQVVKDQHYDVMAGITRTLYLTVPIIGASVQLNNVLEQQKRSQAAMKMADNSRNSMIANMNAKMQTQVAEQQQHELQKIQEDADVLGSLLVGTMLVQQKMSEHDVVKVEELRKARAKYNEISEKAREQRRQSGLDRT